MTVPRLLNRTVGDGRIATLASGFALVAGAARATGHHPAPGAAPAWVGLGLGAAGLVVVGATVALAGGGD